ncbi:MAG: hypothetical protein P8Y67_03245 [Alphaproteobacteria bacterium]
MTKRYEITRTIGDEPMTLIFHEGAFETLPFEVRLLGVWTGCSYCSMESLKPSQRAEIERQGYLIVRDTVTLRNAA